MIPYNVITKMYQTARDNVQDPFIDPITPEPCLTRTNAYGHDLQLVLSLIAPADVPRKVWQLSVVNDKRTAIDPSIVDSIVKQFFPSGPVQEITAMVEQTFPGAQTSGQRQFVQFDEHNTYGKAN